MVCYVGDFRINEIMIRHLESNDVFVFGSNLKGIHGAGASYQALNWGAVWGVGVGYRGQTYAIPTKESPYKSLETEEIKPYVDEFISWCSKNTDKRILVTPIGCGLAYKTSKEMAPLFKECLNMSHVVLPKEFLDELQ